MGSKEAGIPLDNYVSLQRGNTYKGMLLDQPGPWLIGLGSIARNGGFKGSKLRTYGGDSADKILLYPNDLYVSLKDITQSADLLGAIARVPPYVEIGRLTQDTVKLVFKSNNTPKKLIYWTLRTPQYRMYCKAHSTGTTNLGLSREDFLSFPIPKPNKLNSLIVSLLENTEDKIELNRRMNETLEGMAQALFKSWFVDFDPVIDNILANNLAKCPSPNLSQGKRDLGSSPSGRSGDEGSIFDGIPEEFAARAETRRKVYQAKGMALSDGTANREAAKQFPAAFQETEEMGWIPEGWEVKQVKDFGSVVCGKTPSKKNADYYGDAVPFIKIPDMHQSAWITDTSDGLSSEGASSQAKKEVPANSICVSCIATVGKVVITSRPSHTNQQINSVVPSSEAFRYYLYFIFEGMTKKLHDLASGGSATLNLNTGNFSKIDVQSPSNGTLELYFRTVDPLFKKMLSNDVESQSLTKLRDTLLPKLISGELRIEDAEKMVEDI